MDDITQTEILTEEEHSDEKSNLLGGGHKDYEDDFFLTGPKINITSLKHNADQWTDDNGGLGGRQFAVSSTYQSDTENIKFKTWKDNLILKIVAFFIILVVILIIVVIIIHNNFL